MEWAIAAFLVVTAFGGGLLMISTIRLAYVIGESAEKMLKRVVQSSRNS